MTMSSLKSLKYILERIENETVDLDSNLFSIPLRHYELELKKSTPFLWNIYVKHDRDKLVIKITVDKRALNNKKTIESQVINTIKNNETFREFVRSLREFQPDNDEIPNLYTPDTYKRRETENTVTYIKVLDIR